MMGGGIKPKAFMWRNLLIKLGGDEKKHKKKLLF